ncbi:amidohydrolase family protein [Pseudodesulfovibrio sp. zrk46]|uniref:amidohydrolase family protein n=1 Tax=Pseudodesulfovibrio sp. zrk46 TaxID=2725288 RepID=UPI00144942FF|nr:amidohydrolase family protein [Pseudodesulfovibrio sp. zrk46]QJB56138.1 amidohydrolase family protein [Pseudodesulfovibrio sp. zrk46]
MTLSRRTFISSMAGLAAMLTTGVPALGAPQLYAVKGTVISGDGTPPLVDYALLVDGDRISDIVPVNMVGDREIIGPDKGFILPGIINCHCHRIHDNEERRERYLRHGVTSIGDVASPLKAVPELLQSPSGITATAACTGPLLCPPGGYPLPVHSSEHGMIITSPKEGREAVQRLADLGAGMVKIAFEPGVLDKQWPMFDAVTAGAICDEARKQGLIVRCHVEDFAGLEPALNAGVHTVEHVPHRWRHEGLPRPVLDEGGVIPQYRRLLDRMVNDGIILTPTLDVFSRSMWEGPQLYEPVRYFLEQGGTVALGNDHPYRRTSAGMPLNEMRLLGKAGLSEMQIVTAGTFHSAMACGFYDRGLLEPGMKADVLVVAENPLTDLAALGRPSLVIKDGMVVDLAG